MALPLCRKQHWAAGGCFAWSEAAQLVQFIAFPITCNYKNNHITENFENKEKLMTPFFILVLLLLYNFSFFIVVQLQFSQFFPSCAPLPRHPHPPVNPHPVVHVHGSFVLVPGLEPSPSFPHYPPPPSPWSLSVCSLFLCFWFNFACLVCSHSVWTLWALKTNSRNGFQKPHWQFTEQAGHYDFSQALSCASPRV